MTGPQENDKNENGQPPIADGAPKPNPEPSGDGPKNQSALKPAQPFAKRAPRLILIGLGLGLMVAAAIVAFRMGVFGGTAAPEPTEQSATVSEAKGPLAGFATGSMAKLVTYETPQKVDDISFGNREREMINLSDFEGQVVVLNVWATWCAPCVHEMPTLAALQSAYGDKGVTVIPLSIDIEEKFPDVVTFIDGQKPLEVYTDTQFSAPSKFQVVGMPGTFILNKKGEMVARLDGDADWNTPEVHALLDVLISE